MSDRHQFRAKWHDYNGGIYFITICAHEKRHIFGRIVFPNVGTRFIASTSTISTSNTSNTNVGTRFIASELGKIVEDHINNIPEYYQDVELLNHVVMPNHIHMVISIGTQSMPTLCQSTTPNYGCLKEKEHDVAVTDFHHNSRLATIVGAFKAGVTRTARTRRIASLPVWQSRYHEHIIRNKRAFDNIMSYIDSNIENWSKDCFA